MTENKKIRIILFFFTLVTLAAYFAGLFIDVTRDAGKYATVSREIFQNGNFINLTVYGEPYDQKPPLLFWLGALGFSVGGISNFWFKFPVLLLVFAGFYWAYRLGTSLYNRRVGILTAIMLAFSFMYSMYSMDIHTDTPLQAFVTLAFWQLYEFIKTGKNRHWLIGFIAVGLAMLSKGPIGAAIPGFAVVGHLLLKKKFRAFFDIRWYLGMLIAFAVASPALIGLMNQFGWQGIRFFFWDNNVGRFTGTYIESTNDPIFYIHNLIYLFLPWSLLFFIAAFNEFRELIRKRFRSAEFFTLSGIWIYFIIIGASVNQLPNYIFSIMPLIAVVTAKWTDLAFQQKSVLLKTLIGTQTVVNLLLWAGIAVIVLYLFPSPVWYLWLVLATGIAASLFLYLHSETGLLKITGPSMVVFAVLAITMNVHVFPYIFSFQAPPKAARYFSRHAETSDRLFNYHYDQFELFFYSHPEAGQLATPEEMKKIAGKRGNWIFTDKEGHADIEALRLVPDTVIEYHHLYLHKGGLFINPKTRNDVLQPMYLIKY